MFFCISYLDVLSKVYQSVSSNEPVRGQGQGLYLEKKKLEWRESEKVGTYGDRESINTCASISFQCISGPQCGKLFKIQSLK